ncbi:septal ring lytic transglycosylase RlpA family protein [uncultured Algoriphagus sp.]|uniref:septal ring lytic transglycosylase RlpA family protein n=1 Tax=uncultured Algoriphagus sp. TaxID=417365 RepID=UPI00258B375B|nr:septal ring lytic transglycosylase RlpA family protein [uncultured Algoriphagus sp.]
MNKSLLSLLLLLIFRLPWDIKAQGADSVQIQTGWASFYGKRFHLRQTANGEIFHLDSLTAAHKYLPFDTRVKVTRLDTGDTVWVRINDRLPKASRRIIDLSRGAASQLQMLDDGIAQVKLEVASIDAMNELYDQFEGKAPGTLRIRYFEEAVLFRKRPISWAWPIW